MCCTVFVRPCGSLGELGAGGNGGNCGTGVRARISKPTPFIYLAFEKMDPFIYLIVQNVDLFIYCPLIFYTHLLLVVDRYRSQFIEYQENQQPQKTMSEKNIRIYRDVRKVGPFTYESRKMGSVIYFLLKKRGLIIYLAVLKKGAIRHAHPYNAIYSYPPPSRGGVLQRDFSCFVLFIVVLLYSVASLAVGDPSWGKGSWLFRF